MEYEIVRRLARGGMGVVDLARRDDGTLVALKRLALQGTPAEMRQATVRFQRELDVLARLDHDAVVPMLDVVEEAGDVVLVMPYLPGGNLAERVRDDGPMSADEVRALAQRLLPALAAAHRLGIIHRDIKPANVLFDADGRAHLADFGVARTREITGGLTRPGVVLGTPGYLAPEQARGEELTTAADIASLGATLHFAATGQSPYGTGEDHAVLLRTARAKARIDASIEPRLRRTIRSMLRAQPERRPTAAALAGGADGTRLIPALAQRRRPVVLAAVAVVVLVGAALAVGLAWGGADEPEAAPEPAAETTPTEPPCSPTKYQPCGEEPAPGTDGRACLDGRDDYDGLTSNGCEAEADDLDGTELVDRIAAN
ncbi:MAG TPA: serine/threonine-protein kinase, partial [Acidimicrobiales bacterium]|nr:serine/threonine-protein kinase [Acidimicrobiales bacterium]